ncbi:MAG TPA: 1,4-dihydroxy-2-naphthoate polyprenyltransferase [Acetivibrio sp.]|uniref:1,4-dihydroxy-2-naphthoate polyprenyltransferase n=1 Tax=Acetivibrio sp. TaxID=1872092 RepID=UPI002BB0D921|nr:1,4-dihydroxy-2-naphthoate polyprenyltransferase [Acetivibrio sp.]HOM02169.1 1,4-dihydroxy-2-naphthoate polyprenyltransferase [Acetivibrio sp.]
MRVDSFLKLVEIKTKIASMVPFMLGTVYAIYRFDVFNVKNFFFLFISLLCFDMVTTALNNYFDYKRAAKKEGYNYEEHNAIVRDKLGEARVITVILFLMCVAVLFGILLYMNTNIIVLLVGVISFAVGIVYSFGPLPISRMPLGEVFSGFFMGFVIIFLAVFVHIYDRDIVLLALEGQFLSLKLNIAEVLYVFAFSIPAVCGIANIMLANNICDVEDDIENRRYTLPIYIGKEKALWLFEALYYIAFIDILLLSVFRIVPFIMLLVLLVFIPVKKNINLFRKKQTKKDTFELAVKNFVAICGSQLLSLVVSTVFSLVNLL